MKTIFLYLTSILILTSSLVYSQNPNLESYLKSLKKEGEEPVSFVLNKLKEYDLIIFDDALHNSKNPFDYYQTLIQSSSGEIDYVFIEVFGISAQEQLDSFIYNSVSDTSILIKAFQDDFSGNGLRYKTYLDLLETIRVHNISQSTQNKIRAVGVDLPIWWEAINTRKEYDIFLTSLASRDYFMYLSIIEKMDRFTTGKKGIFLTNTRHSYKNIRRKDGEPYWNTGTFFTHFNPQKSYSVRFHNLLLNITGSNNITEKKSAQGLDRITYNWVQPDEGRWEEAFIENGEKSVAIPIKGNIFGNTKYIGNHMLDVLEGEKMENAWDAVIFLKPVKKLESSEKTNFMVTPKFERELERRRLIINGKI